MRNIVLGNHVLKNNVILAPMAGVTDLPFRQLCRSLGVGMAVGEMTSSDISLRDSVKSKLRRVHLNEIVPRSIQIVGWDPKSMAEAAMYNVDQGASIIDINMGCPAKKVCKKMAGSALLGDEQRVGRILDAVVNAVDVPVTLKIRTGVDPTQRNGESIARIAESAGIALLSVHGRTRACKFSGEVEYETIRRIKKAVSLPVIANGDLNSYEKARQVICETGVDGVMIGRAANGAPWFPGQLASYLQTGIVPRDPDLQRQRDIVLEHLQRIYSFYGSNRGVRIARKHIKWYTESMPDSGKFRTLVNSQDSPEVQLSLVSEYYFRIQDFPKAA